MKRSSIAFFMGVACGLALPFVFVQDGNQPVTSVHRVIGSPGDTVEVRGKAVYLNGKQLMVDVIQFKTSK